MRVAVLSDIHSNCDALAAVLRDVHNESPDAMVVLGDMFGYYPWAADTYEMLRGVDATFIRGNHDGLVLSSTSVASSTVARAALHNARQLRETAPAALDWLKGLDTMRYWTADDRRVLLCHGTPADPENGRLYPDDLRDYEWLPQNGNVLLLGHTHYPFFRLTERGGLVANPGSVGQPRDGDPRAAWGMFDSTCYSFEVRRTAYDLARVTEKLQVLGWERRAVFALRKDIPGRLAVPEEDQTCRT